MEHSQGLTPASIFQMGFGFMASKVLLVAAKFELFTFLAEGPKPIDKIKEHLNLHGRGLYDFLDTLVSFGLLERTGIKDSSEYSNTAVANDCLVKGKPSYIGGMLIMAETRLYPAWGNLERAL